MLALSWSLGALVAVLHHVRAKLDALRQSLDTFIAMSSIPISLWFIVFAILAVVQPNPPVSQAFAFFVLIGALVQFLRCTRALAKEFGSTGDGTEPE
ncbi:MAG: hypothetical protein OXU20_40155 [Myxococcales bacterium]|nr:hypothetical protein [Myxococcales bacterium]